MMRPGRLLLVWATVLLLALGCGCGQVDGWKDSSRRLLREPKDQEGYKNLLTAAQSEVRIIQQLYNGVFRDQGWANTEDFRSLLKLALNTTANLTAFFPSDDSWQRVADYYCLTQQGVLDNISNLREMLANYIKAHLVLGETLHSSDFRDGLVLQTMAQPASNPNGPAVNHTLSKMIINGTVTWVFRNASIYKIPGTYDYEDIKVNPKRMDIRAGNAIIHVMDTLFRNVDTERFWEGLRGQVLERAGYPIDSPVCPGNVTARKQEGIAPSQIAGLVIGVVIGLLLLAGVLMLIFVMRSHDSGFLHGPLKTLSATMQRRRRSDGSGGAACSGSSPSGGLDGDGDSPASRSGDMFASPLLRPPPVPPGYLQHQRSTLQPHLSTASSGLTTANSWVTRGSNSSLQVLAADSPAGSMVLVNEDSPFAHVGTPVAAGAVAGASGVLHVARQASSLAADTPTSSSAGAVHRTTDSFGSGTPFVSRGSGHGSKKDLLALAAAGAAAGGAVAHHAYGNGVEQQQQLVDTPLFDSLGGSLAPTESVPVGRINHEHVIPFSELTLKELIGSGAEGKVYRGTWKHTDIAAKEYLPIEPAAQEVTTANGNNNNGHKADSPSDAAMAHARAALAKEVHWLTSLNHPNLVRFCAVCLERPLVVMEFYKHGSVFAMLQKAARELLKSRQTRRKGYVAHFNWDRRLEMLHDVAAGMSYLHGKDHVHGDLRSPNLFVGADGKVKIGDFGFTKRLACNTASLKVKRITHPRWVAPELMMDNTLSQSSDVYSFAIIMFELLTFRIPFDNLGKEQVVINVVQGFRPEVPEECDLPPGTSSSTCLFTYVRLMQECWSHDPAARPSFEVIARRLKAMQRWRTIISKHSTLHRAASALRQSSSCSSLQKQGSPVLVNGIPQQQHVGGMSPIANGHHHTAAAADGASGATYPGTPSAATAAAAGAMSLTNGASGGSSMPRPRSAQPLPVAADGSGTPLPRFGGAPAARGGGVGPSGSVASPSASFKQLQQQSYSPAVPEYSSSECDEDSLPEFEEFEDVDGAALQQGSAPVSEAVVAGTRLAVIGVSSHQDERDALASVAGTAAELSLLARSKVVLVGSDLPAGAFSRQAVRGANSLEEGSSSVRYSRVRPASSAASFTVMGLQSEPATRLSSGANNADRRLPLASASATATVAGAAAALATAAAKTSSSSSAGVNGRLPPNGRTQPQAAVQQPSPQQPAQAAPAAAAVVPAVRTVAVRAAAAAAAGGVEANGHQVVRRHSDPLPPKTRLSADGTTAAAANSSSSPGACDDSATAMSSGQSPFAYVHVGPPELDCTDELQQLQDTQQGHHLLPQHQSMQQPQQQQLDMRYIQSYPLSTTASEVGSPLPSAASTPDQLNAWQQQQRLQKGKHYAIHQQQLQKLLVSKQQQQQQDLRVPAAQRDLQQQQQMRLLLLQQQQSKQVGVQQQQQQLGQQALQIQQQHRHLLESSQQPAAQQQQQQSQQQLQQQQQQQQPSTQQPSSSAGAAAAGDGLTQRHSSLTAEAVAAAAAAGPVGPPVGYEDEVFTPFDSPFYQNMSWAPSASVSGLDSNAGSFSIRNTSAAAMAAAGAIAMASDGSSICSPVHQQQLAALQQQQQLRPASFSSSAAGGAAGAAAAAAAGEASVSAGAGPFDSSSAGCGGDLSAHTQAPSSASGVASPPVLKQALTIAYQENLTPMAAAAAEAVSLHPGSRRSLSSAAGTSPSGAAPSCLPGSRPQSFVVAAAGAGAGGPASLYAPRSCSSSSGTGGAGAAAAAGQFRSTPSNGSMASPAAAGLGSARPSSDVAAAADTGLVLLPQAGTAAASVSLEPLPAGKAAAAAATLAGNKTSSSGRTTPVDQQQQPLGTWGSHMDVVPPVAGAGAVGGCEGAGQLGSEPSAAAVQRPWWRMLGIRRSVHGA